MDQNLIDQACAVLGVQETQKLREGGQKFAAIVDRQGESMVIKVIDLTRANDVEQVLERARRETDLIGEVDHPNVVRLVEPIQELGADPALGVAWLEEHVQGSDLTDYLRVPWEWRDARQLGLHVARGLSELHSRNVVHRDLSPSNVRRTPDGAYVILDPGYARHLDLTTLTVFGQPGTPGFLSPEHLTRTGPSPASDVFGVGILMYLALTGDLPIPLTADVAAYEDALRNKQVPSLAVARPDLLPAQVEVVDVCLNRQPARRYLNGADLADHLEEL
jgi:serine/threonine-protein kinase